MRLAIRTTWVLLVLAAAGAVLLVRRRAPVLEVLAPVALVAVLAVVFYGMTRFRFAAEPSLCVLAAAGLLGAAQAARLPGRAWSPTSSGTSRR
jgi:asparagine N-glycosylation enzyme membrane subunit Stt3